MKDLATTTLKTKRVKPENETVTSFGYFLIETRGFKKQFTNETAARRAFGKLERQKIEDEVKFKITLFGKSSISDSWQELDFVSMDFND